ncbi:MAG: hypothetical protein RL015_907 [Verrucomicrobiota bacterium]
MRTSVEQCTKAMEASPSTTGFAFDSKSNILELNEPVKSTDELSFFYSDDGGTTTVQHLILRSVSPSW